MTMSRHLHYMKKGIDRNTGMCFPEFSMPTCIIVMNCLTIYSVGSGREASVEENTLSQRVINTGMSDVGGDSYLTTGVIDTSELLMPRYLSSQGLPSY